MFFLNSRSVIKVKAENGLNFLNRLVTADLKKIQDGGFLFSAILNSKARFLCDFFIFLINDEVFIDINNNDVSFFINTIKYYDLVDEIKFEIQPNLKVFANEEFLINWKQGKFKGRFLLAEQSTIQNEDIYNEERIKLCLPDGSLELVKEKSIIMDYGYERAGAMSFDKGCYLGQELMTRTKRVGEVRKALACIENNGLKIQSLSSFGNYSLILAYKEELLNQTQISLKEGVFKIFSTSME